MKLVFFVMMSMNGMFVSGNDFKLEMPPGITTQEECLNFGMTMAKAWAEEMSPNMEPRETSAMCYWEKKND